MGTKRERAIHRQGELCGKSVFEERRIVVVGRSMTTHGTETRLFLTLVLEGGEGNIFFHVLLSGQ